MSTTPAIATRAAGVGAPKRLSRHRPATFAITLFTLLTAWAFHKQLLGGWTFPADFLGGASTTPAFVAATIGRAHPLSFSPFVASGFPVDVDPQAGVYFPLWWLLGALHITPTLAVLTVVQVAHVLFGSIGVALLARVRGLSWRWATLAGAAYVFFGGFYGQAEHATFFRGFAYLPWLLWALTPPRSPQRWTRMAAVPPLAWLIASGAYPSQIVSFAIAAGVYTFTALRTERASVPQRRAALALSLAALSCAALCIAVLLPYLQAEHAGELVRSNPPTAAARAAFSISPLDVFGLYLDNYAWTAEGTITAWAIGIPVLVGLACARRATLARHAPLLAAGTVALALAMTPKIGFLGRAMVLAGKAFPSRFPAADYKAVVAVTLIVLSADSWSRIATRDRRPWTAVGLIGCLLIAGSLFTPRIYQVTTSHLPLLVVVVVLSCALALTTLPPHVLVCALVILVTIDGLREINDLGGTFSPWVYPTSAYYDVRDQDARALPKLLARAPLTRPARVPANSFAPANSAGWVAAGYQASDYTPVKERALVQAQGNPSWSRLLLEPWFAATFPCAIVGCTTGAVRLPPANTWRASASVHTISYGADRIAYTVELSKPTLMVENELAIAGWRANSPGVHSVETGTPFRGWRLPAGNYQLIATFHQPGRNVQNLAAAIALAAWVCLLLLVRLRPAG